MKSGAKRRMSRFMPKKALMVPYRWLRAFGVEPLRMIRSLRGIPAVFREFIDLRRQKEQKAPEWNLVFSSPSFDDRYQPAGTASGQYFHQDLLVARRIFERKPRRHVDVGSRVDGFVAHVAVFREIECLDIRPLSSTQPNISFRQCDVFDLPAEFRECCDSLSCLHVLEHFGLGRYGDPVDIDGHLRGFDSLCAILERDGMLYLSVPIGIERIDFNAERVFGVNTVLNMVEGKFNLLGLSFVDDAGDLHENVDLSDCDLEQSFGLSRGCGIFELRKIC